MQSTRYSRPKGHFGTGLTFAVPFGVLGLLAAASLGHPALGVALLAWSLLNRIIQSIAVGYGVVGDRRAFRLCWLYPLRDLLGFILWVASYCGGSSFRWRGELYRFTPGGRIISIQRASDSRLPEISLPEYCEESAPGPASLSPASAVHLSDGIVPRATQSYRRQSWQTRSQLPPHRAPESATNRRVSAGHSRIGPHSTYPEAKRATATAPSSASDHPAPPAHSAAAIAHGSPKVSSTPT